LEGEWIACNIQRLQKSKTFLWKTHASSQGRKKEGVEKKDGGMT